MISVIIPTYNREKYISETIYSVLNQSYKALEVLIIDDGSTDNTQKIVETIAAEDSRVKYIYQINAERSAARNKGIKIAQGEFIAFLDSDDLWSPTKLEKQIKLFNDNLSLVMVVTWWDMFDNTATTLRKIELPAIQDINSGNFHKLMVVANRIGSATPLIRKDIILQQSLFRDICPFEDWEFWTRISMQGAVGLVPEILARHRIHPGNTEKAITPHDYVKVLKVIRNNLTQEKWNSVLGDARKSFYNRIIKKYPKLLSIRFFIELLSHIYIW